MVQGPIFLGAIHFDIPCQPADYPLSWLEKTPYQFAEKNLNLLECFAQLRTFLSPQLRYSRKFDLQVPVFVKACPSFDYPLPTPKELPALGRKLLVLLRNWGLLLLNFESAEGKSTRKGHRPVSFMNFQYCLPPLDLCYCKFLHRNEFLVSLQTCFWTEIIADFLSISEHLKLCRFSVQILRVCANALSTSSYQIVYLVLGTQFQDPNMTPIYHISLYVFAVLRMQFYLRMALLIRGLLYMYVWQRR